MGGVRITDRDKGYRKVVRNVEAIASAPGRLTVGVHASEGSDSYEGGLTVAEVAAIHEYGATVANADGSETTIPQRSWLGGWFDEQLEANKELLRQAARTAVAGRMPLAQAFELVGAKFVGEIQARISQGIPPPNAPSTIAKKGSSTPLIATGQLRTSVTHKVET